MEDAAKKQTKIIKDKAEKQILKTDQKLKSISGLFSKILAEEVKDDLTKIKEI